MDARRSTLWVAVIAVGLWAIFVWTSLWYNYGLKTGQHRLPSLQIGDQTWYGLQVGKDLGQIEWFEATDRIHSNITIVWTYATNANPIPHAP